MKAEDILNDLGKNTFKMMLANDLEKVHSEIRLMLDDIKIFNSASPNLIKEEVKEGLSNMEKLLSLYVDGLIKDSEQGYRDLAKQIGE